MKAPLDQHVGAYLADHFQHQSRRSFLSRLTRGLFAVAGVSLPAVIATYDTSAQQPKDAVIGNDGEDWEWCGLHGYRCEGDCHPTANGNQGRIGNINAGNFGWVACCRNPRTRKWRCVHYIDYCGTPGPNHPVRNNASRCRGTTPSGNLWCGGAIGSYICTMHQMVATEFDSAGGCARGCYPGAVGVCEAKE